MRRALAEAPVGDDQFAEDPSVNRLQELVAEMLGKEAGLFVPSGHMANQLALKLFTRDRKSTRLNSSHIQKSRMPSSA